MKERPTRNFPLGQTVITRAALNLLDQTDVLICLARHARGDWGVRLLSAYQDRNGTKLWIITEADAPRTTILLPEDC